MRVLWRLSKEAARYKGLYAMAILSTLLLTVINLVAPRLLSRMTDVVGGGMTDQALGIVWSLALGLLLLYLVRVLFRYLSNYLAHKAAWNLVEDLRKRVYGHLQTLSMGYYHDKQTGDLMSRVVNDTSNFELLYAHLIPELCTNLLTVFGVLAVLLTINWQLGLLTCIPIPFIFAAGWIFSTKVQPCFRRSQKALAELNAKLQDNFSGMHEIQSFGTQAQELQNVSVCTGHFTKAMLHALNLSAIFHPSVEFCSSMGTVIVVGLGGVLALRGQLSVADVVAFLLYLSLFYTPIAGLGRLLEEMQQALAGAERVAAVLDTPPDIADAPDAKPLNNPKGRISFENVSFAYQKDQPVLQNISFSCEPGEMVALVGPTGVGKTTLTQLIPRFYDPDEGVVRIDGQDLRGLRLQSLRQAVAPVLQDTFLFNATILENIRYANPDATDEEVVEAAKAAHIHEDILRMPEGYLTGVGERGVRLSGGQKQRIAIARAILRPSPIVILDEATASVDVETEKQIQEAIQALSGKRTIVAIAHRLSTIRSADQILVLEEGRVVQRGTHAQLVDQEGLYQRLQRAQSLAE